jgi:transposase-like protein
MCHALVRRIRASSALKRSAGRTSGKRVGEVAQDLGVSQQALRNWVRQGDLDDGLRSDGLTSSELSLDPPKHRDLDGISAGQRAI